MGAKASHHNEKEKPDIVDAEQKRTGFASPERKEK